ncbi:MAG: prevent-host-death protein [bacterium]
MAHLITANELKTKGISILDKKNELDNEIIVTVRGKSKYIILTIEKYTYLRECELEAALLEAKRDIKSGKFIKESIDRHLKRIIRG